MAFRTYIGGPLMAKKTLAALALALLAVFAVPAAANAAGYVPESNVVVSGSATPSSPVYISFAAASFTPGEQVSYSVTGEGTATLAIVKAATASLVKSATSDGAASVVVTLPANATGTYTTTATGLTSGNVGTAAITVAAADSGAAAADDKGLASTGFAGSALIFWAAGLLLAGIALVVVLSVVRRQRANA